MNSIERLPGVRKRDKIRAVWISFAGRIAAQLIGAIATVTLGVLVLNRAHAPAEALEQAAAAQPTVLIATPIRTHGETVIVMMPVGKNGKVDARMAAEVADSYEKSKATALTEGLANAPRQTPTDRPAPQSTDRSADTRASLESPRE
jgi:hypothetical protein